MALPHSHMKCGDEACDAFSKRPLPTLDRGGAQRRPDLRNLTANRKVMEKSFDLIQMRPVSLDWA